MDNGYISNDVIFDNQYLYSELSANRLLQTIVSH